MIVQIFEKYVYRYYFIFAISFSCSNRNGYRYINSTFLLEINYFEVKNVKTYFQEHKKSDIYKSVII